MFASAEIKSSEFVVLFLYLSQMLTLSTLTQNLFRNCYDHKLEPALCTQYTDKVWSWMRRGSNPSISKKLFPKTSTPAQRPTQLPIPQLTGFFPRRKVAGAWKVAAYLHLVVGIRTDGAVSLLPQYAYMWWRGTWPLCCQSWKHINTEK